MKNSLQVAGGVVGAVIGFVATLLLLELVGFGNRADPITSGMLALLVLAPLGAIAGLVARHGAGEAAARRRKHRRTSPQQPEGTRRCLIALCAAAGTSYYVYAVTTATPWLNPNAATPLLVFEVRLPAGAALPNSARDITIELQTDINTHAGRDPRFDQFRSDGDRPVIAGDVELAFRTAHRQLELKINGQPDRLYRIGTASQGAACVRSSDRGSRIPTAAKFAIAPNGRDEIDPCLPRLVCRVPGLSFVSPRLNLDSGWVTHSRERHCADTAKWNPLAVACRPQSVWYPEGALERLFASRCHLQLLEQSEPWPRFATSSQADLARHQASQRRAALRPSWQAISPVTAA